MTEQCEHRQFPSIIVASVAILFALNTDYPKVQAMPTRIYLPRGMLGKIECPVEANPPMTHIIWMKNEKIIDLSHLTRMKVNKQGTLIIKSVMTSDDGRYSCIPYSPLGAGQMSMPVQILIKGQFY